MKKRIWAWAFAVAMLGGSISVQAQEVTKDNTDNTTAVAVEQKNAETQVTFKKIGGEIRDGRKGTALIKIKGNIPVLTDTGSNTAIEKINAYYNDRAEEIKKQKDALYKEAKQYYNDEIYNKSVETTGRWEGYQLGMHYTLASQNDRAISFIEEDDNYSGDGTHVFKRSIQNFDMKTGKQLAFKDVVTDEAKAKEYILNYIKDEIKDAEDDDTDYLYYGYKDHIDECLAEGNWYLSDSSLVIVFNEYVFTPEAEGMHSFWIPMSTCKYIKPEYKK